MAPRAPPTPRTTRNSRGLRRPLDRLPEEAQPQATPAPSGQSLIAALGRRSISPTCFLQVPSPFPLRAAQVTAPSPLSPLPEAQVTAPTAAPETPRGTVASLPAKPVEKALPKRLAWVVEPSWVKDSTRESRIFKATKEKRGARFARELLWADRNDRFMRNCDCRFPVVYDNKQSAERGLGAVRFYLDDDKNLSVLYKKTDRLSRCDCGKERLPVYGKLLNQNGKRPAEDSELELLAQDVGQTEGTEVERVIPSPTERAPRRQSAARRKTLLRRSMSYLTQLKTRLQTMGTSFLGLFGRSQSAGRDHDVVDRRHASPDNKAIVAKRFKRQVCLPAGSGEPDDDLKEHYLFTWRSNATSYIGVEKLRKIGAEFSRQLQVIESGNVIFGRPPARIRDEIQPGQELDLSLRMNLLFLEEGGGEGIFNEPSKNQESVRVETENKYRAGLESIVWFINNIYRGDLFEEVRQRYPRPSTPFTAGDGHFRKKCHQAASFLNFLLQSDPMSGSPMCAEYQEAISKIIMDGNAIHKQELPLSYVTHQLKLPGGFPPPGLFSPPILEEFAVEDITVDRGYDVKYPWSEAEGNSLGPCLDRPKKSVLKKPQSPKESASPQQQSASPHPESASAQEGPAPEKRRKLAFGTTSFSRPDHIPFSIQREIEFEERAAKSEIKRTIWDGMDPSPNQVDLNVLTATHERLGLPTPSNYLCAKITGKRNAEEDDARLNLQSLAADYTELLDEMRDPGPLTMMGGEPKLVTPDHFHVEQVQKSRDEEQKSSGDKDRIIIPGPKIEQTIEPKVPIVTASATKQNQKPPLTAEQRKAVIDKFFESDVDEELKIATAKFDEFSIERQVKEEFTNALARQVKEKEQREIQRKAEEEEKRREEERRRAEEERRRQAEEQRRAADARRRKEAAQYAQLTGLRPPARPMITPLDGEWNQRITRASQAAPNAELTTTLDGNPLRRDDFSVRLLPPTAWLNDNVIIGSILYIAQYINDTAGVNSKQNPKCAALTSFFWPRLQSHGLNSCARLMRLAGIRKENFLDIDTILVPICQANHWTLGVVCPSRRTVSHIDSMRAGGSNPAISNRLMEWAKATLGDAFVEADWKQITYRAPLQTNGYDCGVFTITNAICLALGVDPNAAYTERELTLQRQRLAAILLNGGFKGDFTLEGL
ncbi:hypothetical protein V8F20_000306 [Naviculisporaceae sp. PSN 640]